MQVAASAMWRARRVFVVRLRMCSLYTDGQIDGQNSAGRHISYFSPPAYVGSQKKPKKRKDTALKELPLVRILVRSNLVGRPTITQI